MHSEASGSWPSAGGTELEPGEEGSSFGRSLALKAKFGAVLLIQHCFDPIGPTFFYFYVELCGVPETTG